MTYTGAMVLPQNAVVMQEEEMRYLEGGKTWSKTFSVPYKNKKHKYKITVNNVGDVFLSAVGIAVSAGIIYNSIAAAVASAGSLSAASAAGIMAGIAGIGMSLKTIKKNITVKKL